VAALIAAMINICISPDDEQLYEQIARFIATEVMLDEAAKRY